MKTKVIFLKNAAGIGYGYFAGDTAELETKAFDDLKTLNFVKEHIPEKETPAEEVSDLPADLPGRQKLIDAGFTTLADIKDIKDLTDIKGIGKTLAFQIAEKVK